MRNVFLSVFTTPSTPKRSIATQLGFFFTVVLIVLFVISTSITSSYSKVIEQDRADNLQSTAAAAALAIAHTDLQPGMVYPLPTNGFIINIYTKAGNSFLQVYTSNPTDKSVAENQVTLTGAGESYRQAFDQQYATVVTRSDASGSFVAGIAPIIGKDGTATGLLEVLMPAADFYATQNGLSLSWFFTIIAIAVALTIVYYETHRLLDTMFGQPDRMLPKIIRYGLSGCQSIAFFSAMACVMPVLVISSFFFSSTLPPALTSSLSSEILIAVSSLLFVWGFFGFSSIRASLVRRFTTRVSLILFIFLAFVMMLVSAVLSNVYVYMLLMLPIGFSLGMVFYFQREYRIYASRLGYEGFSERIIHNTQYTGHILGACVGAVITGIVFERFGLLAVSLICGCILLIVGVQSLLFVQHCPPSSGPTLHLPSYLYALSSKKSGTFLWSAVMTLGIQAAFFFIFVPNFLHVMLLSMATIAFYYILFAFMGSVLIKFLLKVFPGHINMKGRVLFAAVLQIMALLLLGIMPTAKILVISVMLMGTAMGLHEFRYLNYYQTMIREDKKVFARSILEHAFAWGAIIGTAAYSALFIVEDFKLQSSVTGSVSAPFLIFTFLMGILLLAYPISNLLFTTQHFDPDERTNSGQEGYPNTDGNNYNGIDAFNSHQDSNGYYEQIDPSGSTPYQNYRNFYDPNNERRDEP